MIADYITWYKNSLKFPLGFSSNLPILKCFSSTPFASLVSTRQASILPTIGLILNPCPEKPPLTTTSFPNSPPKKSITKSSFGVIEYMHNYVATSPLESTKLDSLSSPVPQWCSNSKAYVRGPKPTYVGTILRTQLGFQKYGKCKFPVIMAEVSIESHIIWEPFQTPFF